MSRKILQGKLQGEKRSKRRGQSVEFADHRPYVADICDLLTERLRPATIVAFSKAGPNRPYRCRRQQLDEFRRAAGIFIRSFPLSVTSASLITTG
jgi:hypothetical protein